MSQTQLEVTGFAEGLFNLICKTQFTHQLIFPISRSQKGKQLGIDLFRHSNSYLIEINVSVPTTPVFINL